MNYPTHRDMDDAVKRAHKLRAEAMIRLFRKLFRLK
jgi:hypothetical protein